MTKPPLFSHSFLRVLTAVLGCLLVSVVIVAAMPTYLPFELGNRIAGPSLLFPFLWLALFLYSVIASSLLRVWSLLGVLLVSHIGLIVWALYGS